MIIYPRHMAALQYSLLAIFLLASWQLLLSPAESILEQFESAFSASSEHRAFFFSFAFAGLVSVLLGVSFWLKRSTSPFLSAVLAVFSSALFGFSFWQFDTTLIFSFGLGCVFAIWSWFAPNMTLNRTRKNGAPVI